MNYKMLNYNAVLRDFYMADLDIRAALAELRRIPDVERWQLAWDIVHAHPERAKYVADREV